MKKKKNVNENEIQSETESDMSGVSSWLSADVHDAEKDGEQEPEDSVGVKKTFRSHFDVINLKLQQLRVRQKKQ